jgi:hypothetical protein
LVIHKLYSWLLNYWPMQLENKKLAPNYARLLFSPLPPLELKLYSDSKRGNMRGSDPMIVSDVSRICQFSYVSCLLYHLKLLFIKIKSHVASIWSKSLVLCHMALYRFIFTEWKGPQSIALEVTNNGLYILNFFNVKFISLCFP